MKNKSWLLTALSLGFFMVIMDVTVVNVALPTIAKSLNGGIAWLQWVVDGYTLTFACLLLSAGDIGDRLGAKAVFIWGLILFVLTSAGCGFAADFEELVLFRLLQGIGAALILPTSVALLKASYETLSERAQALGTRAGIAGIAAAIAPLIGAFLTTWWSWRAIFFVNIPFGILTILLTLYFVPNFKNKAQEKNPFDWIGQILGIISIAALAFGLIEAGRLGWLSHLVIISFIVFLVTFILFLFRERYAIAPMLPLSLFKSKLFSASVFISMILTFSFYGQFFLLTLYFQQVRHYSVMMTGFAFLPVVGFNAISSYLSGKTMSRIGIRVPIMMGLLAGALGFFVLLITETQGPPYWILFFPLALMGFSIAYAAPAAANGTIHAVPEGRAGVASGAYNTSRQIGVLLSVAIFGTIVNTVSHFMLGMHISLIISALANLLGLWIAILYIKNI